MLLIKLRLLRTTGELLEHRFPQGKQATHERLGGRYTFQGSGL